MSNNDTQNSHNKNSVIAVIWKSGMHCDSKYEYDHDCGYWLTNVYVPSHNIDFDSGRFNNKINVHKSIHDVKGEQINISESLANKLKQISDMNIQIENIKKDINNEVTQLFVQIKENKR